MNANIEKKVEELEKKMGDLTSGQENKLSMVVFSGDLDKILAALIIATGAVAMGLKVSIFWTFWATTALRDSKKKARGKKLIEKMFGWMLPRGVRNVKLSRMHMGGMGTAMIKSIMKKKNVASAEQMIEMAGQLGVEFCICEMSMELMGMKRGEMIDYPKLKYCGVATFLAEAKTSKVQLFI